MLVTISNLQMKTTAPTLWRRFLRTLNQSIAQCCSVTYLVLQSRKKNEPGSSGPINHRGLFRNLFATAVSGEKEDDRGSSDPAVRVALGVSEKNQDAMAVSDVKEEDDPGISVPTYTVLVLSFSWWRVSGASN